MFDKKNTRLHFERAAETYDASAILQKEVAEQLSRYLDHLVDIPVDVPETVLDIGSGTGFITQALLQRYPESSIIALDFAYSMARKSQQLGSSHCKPQAICADAEKLPLASDSIALLISSLMLQWSNDLKQTVAGFQHVLAPNGLLLFSTLGPETLYEMRESWAVVDDVPHTSHFLNVQAIEESLVESGFINPVIERKMITQTYPDVRQLMRAIKQIGASNTHHQRGKGLMGKQKLNAFDAAYEQFKTREGLYPATWEVIYAYAWKAKL